MSLRGVLPAAVWGTAGCGVTGLLVFRSENWEGRNLLWSQSKLQPQHPCAILPP